MKKIVLLCSLIALSLVSCCEQGETTAPKNCAWEYKVVELSGSDVTAHTTAINELTKQGWVLVNSHSAIATSIGKLNNGYEHIDVKTHSVSYVFKRPYVEVVEAPAVEVVETVQTETAAESAKVEIAADTVQVKTPAEAPAQETKESNEEKK
jgi:hypothetical protein